MPLKPSIDKSSCTLIISVQNDGSVAQMTRDLDDALTLVRESLGDRDLFYSTIDVSGTWRPGDGEVHPWDEPFINSWAKLTENRAMRGSLASWLGRVTKLVETANATCSSCLGESDTTQFGEVPAALLAMADRQYVPIYVELLKVWDLDHAVSQFEVAEKLVEKHGNNTDTKDLVSFVETCC